MQHIIEFLKDEDGPTAVEYAVMLVLIVGACLGWIIYCGEVTDASFQNSGNEINSTFQGIFTP